jgi:hypothetical protein
VVVVVQLDKAVHLQLVAPVAVAVDVQVHLVV